MREEETANVLKRIFFKEKAPFFMELGKYKEVLFNDVHPGFCFPD